MPKRAFAGVLLLAVSVVIALALGEGGLRLAGFSYPSFWIPDDLVGSRLRPGIEGWQRGEGEAYVKVNREGFRDREHALAKPPGTFRIAVLGDSFTEALQLPLQGTFWSILEGKLNACHAFPARTVEVLNFGISGYGTADELLTLRYRALQYAPDLVLLAFFPGNDVRNNSKALEPDQHRPFYFLQGGQLALDNSFLRDPDFQTLKRVDAARRPLQDLRLYQLLRRLRAGHELPHFGTPVAIALAGGTDGTPSSLGEPGLDENVLRAPQDAAWRNAWVLTDRLLVAVRDAAEAGGARFMMVVVSTAGSVYPDPGLRQRYAERLGVPDLSYPERHLEQLASQNGFDLLALAPAMQAYADSHRVFLHGFPNSLPGFGHWNAEGHRVAAELIARDLCARPPR